MFNDLRSLGGVHCRHVVLQSFPLNLLSDSLLNLLFTLSCLFDDLNLVFWVALAWGVLQ